MQSTAMAVRSASQRRTQERAQMTLAVPESIEEVDEGGQEDRVEEVLEVDQEAQREVPVVNGQVKPVVQVVAR